MPHHSKDIMDLDNKTREEYLAIIEEQLDELTSAIREQIKSLISQFNHLYKIRQALPDLPKPVAKLQQFLGEEIERLKPRGNAETLMAMLIEEFRDPKLAKRRKSADSARRRELERLTKTFRRFQPELITKIENLNTRMQAQSDALREQLRQKEAHTQHLQEKLAQLQAEKDHLESHFEGIDS